MATECRVRPRLRRYRLLAEGYSICLIFLTLAAGSAHPLPPDSSARLPATPRQKLLFLDRFYQRLTAALDR